jgi:hypothetical protein
MEDLALHFLPLWETYLVIRNSLKTREELIALEMEVHRVWVSHCGERVRELVRSRHPDYVLFCETFNRLLVKFLIDTYRERGRDYEIREPLSQHWKNYIYTDLLMLDCNEMVMINTRIEGIAFQRLDMLVNEEMSKLFQEFEFVWCGRLYVSPHVEWLEEKN